MLPCKSTCGFANKAHLFSSSYRPPCQPLPGCPHWDGTRYFKQHITAELTSSPTPRFPSCVLVTSYLTAHGTDTGPLHLHPLSDLTLLTWSLKLSFVYPPFSILVAMVPAQPAIVPLSVDSYSPEPGSLTPSSSTHRSPGVF